MANPAWKKTAERMTPKGTFDSSRPSSTLTLDWVHGYRGFDCRNNVTYADMDNNQILFTAAALSIVQVIDRNENENDLNNIKSNKKQSHFGEHTDDIISVTMLENWDNKNKNNNENILIATGEIGKIPAINIYNYIPIDQKFEMQACAKGFHTTGVSQLCFSKNGNRLFSIGLDYTIAVYDTQRENRTAGAFGKMVRYNRKCKKCEDLICLLFNFLISVSISVLILI